MEITQASGADTGYFDGGGRVEEGGWYLGVEESMGHAPKLEKWNVIKNRFSRDTAKITMRYLRAPEYLHRYSQPFSISFYGLLLQKGSG